MAAPIQFGAEPENRYDKQLDEILDKLHEHGFRCYCENQELGLTKAEAKAALQQWRDDEVLAARTQEVDRIPKVYEAETYKKYRIAEIKAKTRGKR